MSKLDHKIAVVRRDDLLHFGEFAASLPPGGRLLIAALAPGDPPVSAVGGAVRDYLLGRPVVDVDLVVEGDAINLAGQLGERLGVPVHREPRFGTARLEVAGSAFDLVTARREWYPEPGSLPEVEPAPLAEDLVRRDFTVNAIAVAVRPPHAVLAPELAPADLRRRLLRPFHEGSFRDDPTRLLRLARYAALLGFRRAPGVARLVERDGPLLAAVSQARVRHELDRTLLSVDPLAVVRRTVRYGLLRHLGSQCASRCLAHGLGGDWFRTAAPPRERLFRGWTALVLCCPGLAGPAAAGQQAARIRGVLEQAARAGTGAATALAGTGDAILAGAAALAHQPEAREPLETMLANLRKAGPLPDGITVQRWLGEAPGPRLGAALQGLRAAALRGEIAGPESARRWLEEWATL